MRIVFRNLFEFEVLSVAVNSRMLDACLEHNFLPPIIVHPDAEHVRDVCLYDVDQGLVAAVAVIDGWGWHCKFSMVRTARVAWMDETVDGFGYDASDLANSAEAKDSTAGPIEPGAIPLVNCLAVHHQLNNSYPSHIEVLESAIRNRKKLLNHPLFKKSIEKMQTEPLVRTFYLTYGEDVGLAIKSTLPA